MSDEKAPEPGSIAWTDLTVDNAEEIKDFYTEVVGWKPVAFDMGDYTDFTMNTPDSGRTVAGVCHARGVNAGLPPQWLIYIIVEDVAASAARCTALGGRVIAGPKKMGAEGEYCVIEDPAGAAVALFAPAR
ncbi:MAG: VOC family protein [Candidatus Latescibacterota bacterium]|nr:MAG: VOC family protein [Candidatus Latescibacterota bacterium]